MRGLRFVYIRRRGIGGFPMARRGGGKIGVSFQARMIEAPTRQPLGKGTRHGNDKQCFE